MKKKLLSFLALFISLSIYFSCTDEGVEVSGLQRINPDSDLLAYAMNLVGENGEGCSLIDLQKGSTNSRTVTDYSTVATPLWNKAKTERHGDEEVLIVPLQSEDEIYSSLYFEEEEMGRLYQTKSFSRLVVRSKNGHTVTQVFTYLPGRNYAKNRQAVLDTMGFSPLAIKYYGTILISDLEGKFQQGFYYERGVPTIHLTPKKHMHTVGSRSINDSTECDNHEHSHSEFVYLKLTGSMRIVSRSTNEGEEIQDEENEANYCPLCGSTEIYDHTCFACNASFVYCEDCGKLKGQCVCSYIPSCPVCHLPVCVCTSYVCDVCGKVFCICNDPKPEPECEHCGKEGCKGECQNTKPNENEVGQEEQPNLNDTIKNELHQITSTDVLARTDLKDFKRKKQKGNTCVSTSLEYIGDMIDKENSPGSKTINKFYQKLVNEKYKDKINVKKEGIPNREIYSGVSNFFGDHITNVAYSSTSMDYKAAINNGNVVMTNVQISSNMWHNIVVFGYTNKGEFIYIDPNDNTNFRKCSDNYLRSNNNQKYSIVINISK